jgi:hypothetical protein
MVTGRMKQELHRIVFQDRAEAGPAYTLLFSFPYVPWRGNCPGDVEAKRFAVSADPEQSDRPAVFHLEMDGSAIHFPRPVFVGYGFVGNQSDRPQAYSSFSYPPKKWAQCRVEEGNQFFSLSSFEISAKILVLSITDEGYTSTGLLGRRFACCHDAVFI